MDRARHSPRRQAGAVTVETALASVLFFAMVMGVMEFGRMAYTYASAVEATRIGARLAAVCDVNDADVKAKMRIFAPQLTNADITITYPAANCIPPACDPVTVSIAPTASFNVLIPLAPLNYTFPAFKTSVLAESLTSTNNSVCQ